MDIVQTTTKIILVSELDKAGMKRVRIADEIGIGRATLYRWLGGIERAGSVEGFIDQYLSAKKGKRTKRKVDGYLKRLVYDLREENNDCCGQKIAHYLDRDYGIKLGVITIYKILKEKYQLRSKWKKNKVRGPVPEASKPREVIQMDTVDLGEIFAFNGVDIFTKEVDIVLRPSLTSHDGLVSLKTSMKRRFDGYSDLIQTDGGPEYKDEFKTNVLRFTKRHRVARAYKKNEQSYIESFNRSLRKECVGWYKYKISQLTDLKNEVEDYLKYYHTKRAHLSLNMQTPEEFRLSHI
jgi:transposase